MLECVCVVSQGGEGGQTPPQALQRQPRHCEDKGRRPGLKDIDLCEIVKRSEDESSKHNDHECHLKGEKRQNLINKIKMYLDDYDDRPVMKGKGKGNGGDTGKALGQTGFGPMIKYPGYVDYDHPYFSDPYNKMPVLATTVGQRGRNPCPPQQVRNWDSFQQHGKAGNGDAGGVQGDLTDIQEDKSGRCHCAERSDEAPRCPAAGRPRAPPQGGVRLPQQMMGLPPGAYVGTPPQMSPRAAGNSPRKYLCIPLPDDA